MEKRNILLLIICFLLLTTIPVSIVEAQSKAITTDGAKIYEAEDASTLSAAIIATEHVGYTGTGFVDYKPNQPGGYIEWIVDVPIAGDYVLEFNYASGASENRPAEIKVNGDTVEPNLAFNPTGAWNNWEQTKTVANLKAGENVIRATATGSSGGANIDHLKLYYDSNYFDEVLESEDAKGFGTIVATEHVGYTGLGFVDYKPNQPGGYLEWTVDVPASGEYALQFRYGNGSAENRAAEVKVNGNVVETNLAFNPTGAWDNWLTTQTAVSLKAGKNIIRATATGSSGGANIDNLRVYYAFDELFEAEDVVSSSGTIVATEHVGYTGLGFVDYKPNQPGGYLEWTVDVPDTGRYALQFRYGNGSAENRPAEIKVNRDVIKSNLAFNPTGAWDNWQLTKTTVMLKAGKNVIRATATGASGGANIDHLRVLSSNMIQENVDPLAKLIQVVEVSDIVNKFMLEELARKGLLIEGEPAQTQVEKRAEEVTIKSAKAVTANIVLVTLDGAFKEFDVNDIRIVAPKNDWQALKPDLTDYLVIKEAAVGRNKEGNTVIVYKLADDLDQEARLNTKKLAPEVIMDKDMAKEAALNIVSWQMDHGGWTKHMEEKYKTRWDGKAERTEQFGPNGEELGSIDNGATITQMRFIAKVYRETKIPKLKKSFLKGLDFLFTMQYETGGFPQVYPKRARPDEIIYYSNYVTYNDNAMINVLNMFDDILNHEFPFDSDLVDQDYLDKISISMEKGVDYILKSQVKIDGKLTAWCAQHDPKTYEPLPARVFEHTSISGSESVGIVKFLMDRPNQTPEIQRAVNGALRWFEEAKIEGVKYIRNDPAKKFFYEDPNSNTWYRFYDIETMKPIFSGMDGIIRHDLRKIEEERQYGYSWAGSYPQALLDVVNSIGYYGNGRVYAKVVKTNSENMNGIKLKDGDVKLLNKLDLDKFENMIQGK